jgi:hypothetical protein
MINKNCKLIIVLAFLTLLASCAKKDWRNASREPAGIAPNPSSHQTAVIQVYGADAFSWRGWFAVHTWIAIKEQGASKYTVYEVVGWRVKKGLSALRTYQTETPDRYWYGAKPEAYVSISGPQAATLIPKIKAAIKRYPYADQYTLFPGPNSNTFPAWVGKQVPELNLILPFSALGSGYAN